MKRIFRKKPDWRFACLIFFKKVEKPIGSWQLSLPLELFMSNVQHFLHAAEMPSGQSCWVQAAVSSDARFVTHSCQCLQTSASVEFVIQLGMRIFYWKVSELPGWNAFSEEAQLTFLHAPIYWSRCDYLLTSVQPLKQLEVFKAYVQHLIHVAGWPSGLRRCVRVAKSPDAWGRIPLLLGFANSCFGWISGTIRYEDLLLKTIRTLRLSSLLRKKPNWRSCMLQIIEAGVITFSLLSNHQKNLNCSRLMCNT